MKEYNKPSIFEETWYIKKLEEGDSDYFPSFPIGSVNTTGCKRFLTFEVYSELVMEALGKVLK
jgi:hypothetical protein